MEVLIPLKDFHFDSTTTTPYVSAPSSPKRFGDSFDLYRHYTSAPTSPTRAAAIYAHFNTMSANNSLRLSSISPSSAIPFDWEEKPGTPKARSPAAASGHDSTDVFDFAFDFSGNLDKEGIPPALLTADELFEEGKIRPLKVPPRLQYPVMDDRSSAASSPTRSPKPKGLWSPLHRRRGGGKGVEFDPFTAAMVEATKERGRERAPTAPSILSSRSRKGSRSLSPLRRGGGGGGGFFQKYLNSASPTAATSSTNTPKSGGSKKWRLRDLLLFRSASEGRATGNRSKDPLQKYTILSTSNSSLSLPVSKKNGLGGGEDPRNSSFGSVDSNGSMRRGNRSAVSAHMHYTASRAATEEMKKKKTPLPYRQNLFSCLRFNPAVNRIARGFGKSFMHGRSS